MLKKEFLDTLRSSLEGEINPFEINNNVKFYNDFIDNEVSSGKPIEDIMNELGNPRLIARTIIETSRISKSDMDSSRKNYDNTYNNYQDDSYGRQDYSNNNDNVYQMNYNSQQKVSFRAKLVRLLTVISIFFIIFVIAKIAISLVVTLGLPILIVYFLYVIIFKGHR